MISIKKILICKELIRIIHLLVIEDEIALQKVLVAGLKSLGFKVDGAGDGKKALDLYYENNYDLIILDLNLPFIDGFELLENFRMDSLEKK